MSPKPATAHLIAMPEPRPSSTNAYKRALSLALYILGDIDQAKEVASRVASSHSQELKKQIKNRKTKKHPKWSRVLRNTEFNLDILTYVMSTQYEKRQERAHWERKRMLDEERMTIRFIKHIILEGLKRNSSYLNVGLGRLVFYYPYEKILEVQKMLEQSSDDLPEIYRYRKHRQVLFESLRQRFNGKNEMGRRFLRFKPFSQHEESVIIARGNSSEYYPLVIKSLTTFTPQSPQCPEPLHTTDPRSEVIEPLYFDDRTMDRSEEHAIERNRMHAVICPACFNRILSVLNTGKPENNLRLPLFSLNDGGEGATPESRHNPPHQAPGQSLQKGQKAGETIRSENLMFDKIVIAVDDEPRERMDLKNPHPVQLDLEAGAAIIEVLTEEDQGSKPLGLIYLDWDPDCDEETPAQYELKLDQHCTLEFLISYQIDSDGEEKAATVRINCAAKALLQKASAGG